MGFFAGFVCCLLLIGLLVLVIVFWGPIIALLKAVLIGLGCFFSSLGTNLPVPPPTRVIVIQQPAVAATPAPTTAPTSAPTSVPQPADPCKHSNPGPVTQVIVDPQPGNTYIIVPD